jgi:hypothetical protein
MHPIHSIGPKTYVLGCFGPLRYCSKVDAKLAELVPLTHKFAKRRYVGKFRMNAPDPLSLTQNSGFGVFRTVPLLHECRCKTTRNGNINAQVRYTKLRRNFSQRTHPIHSDGPTTHVLGSFGPFRYCMKVDANVAELVPLMHKFSKRGYVRKYQRT